MVQSVYLRPAKVEDALQALASRPFNVLAGGTDFYPARVGRAVREDILDITASGAAERYRCETRKVGASAPSPPGLILIDTPLPSAFDGVKLAAREVGGRQIQNTATVAGNLCNASPAADGIPPLMAIVGTKWSWLDQGATADCADRFRHRQPTHRTPADELVTAVLVPRTDRVAFGLPQARHTPIPSDLHCDGGCHARRKRRTGQSCAPG